MYACICHSEICRLAGFLLAHHPAFFCSALHTDSQLEECHRLVVVSMDAQAQSSPPTSASGEIWRNGTKAWRQSSCSKEGQCSTFQNIHKAHFSPMALHVGHSVTAAASHVSCEGQHYKVQGRFLTQATLKTQGGRWHLLCVGGRDGGRDRDRERKTEAGRGRRRG